MNRLTETTAEDIRAAVKTALDTELMKSQFGDFIRDTNGVITTLETLDAQYGANNKAIFQQALLALTQDLLGTHEFLPLAGTIIGYIVNIDPSPENQQQIISLIRRLDAMINATIKDADSCDSWQAVTTQTAIETYVCMARMLTDKQALCRPLQEAAIDHFYLLPSASDCEYVFEACAANPHNSAVSDAILCAAFSQLATTYLANKESQESTYKFGLFCGNVALGLPDQSPLENIIAPHFFRSLDNLKLENETFAYKMVLDLSQRHQSRESTNTSFKNSLREAYNRIRQEQFSSAQKKAEERQPRLLASPPSPRYRRLPEGVIVTLH